MLCTFFPALGVRGSPQDRVKSRGVHGQWVRNCVQLHLVTCSFTRVRRVPMRDTTPPPCCCVY